MQKYYSVKGMSCAACSARVKKAVDALDGVNECNVNLLTNSMTVDGEASSESIVAAVKAAGYRAKEVKSPDKVQNTSDNAIKELIIRLITSVIVSAVLMFLSMKQMCLPVQVVLSLAVILINFRFFINGFRGIIKLSPNMDTLIMLGSGISFLYSLISVVLGKNSSGLYFDSAAMILTFITIGKLLEAVSKGRTTDAINSLKQLVCTYANVERRGRIIQVPVEEVVVGDIFLVTQGDAFPVDGKVVFGEGSVDESALTGESRPVDKREGDDVFTSGIVLSGKLKCRAVKVGEETFLSQIIRMVSQSASSKAPIARIADKVSARFVPAVLILGLITFFIHLFIGNPLSLCIERGICVLVVSCPCALGLATPVAIMVGSGAAARHGILFKNATALENAAKADLIILDKTGTITKGDLVKGDSIKEDSLFAINCLKRLKKKIIMLTGDKEEIAAKTAEEVGIDEFVSEVLPQGKEEVVSREMKEHKVIMVGDGINDAVALTTAHVGVAIGSGKDVAIDSADVVLLNNSLVDLVNMILISQITVRKIKSNLLFAFLYNLILIPVAAGALLPFGIALSPMLCALAMSLSSFTVVMNSLGIRMQTSHIKECVL